MKATWLSCAVLCLVLNAWCVSADAETRRRAPPVLARDEIVIRSGDDTHRFQVELALTPAERERGLMFRERLDPEEGMLFVHEPEITVRMWMRNTLIPLDMLFIAGDGRIFQIVEGTTPFSSEILVSDRPARGVLEINAGMIRRLGIAPGDRVVHPVFTPGR